MVAITYLAILSEVRNTIESPKSIEAYVKSFKDQVHNIAKHNLQHTVKNVGPWSFEEADRVLVLRPLVGSPFESKFDGPYTVLQKVSDENYLVSILSCRKKSTLFHVNMMKPYCDSVCVKPVLTSVLDCVPFNKTESELICPVMKF